MYFWIFLVQNGIKNDNQETRGVKLDKQRKKKKHGLSARKKAESNNTPATAYSTGV